MTARAPLPPFPRWTGAHVRISGRAPVLTQHADGRRSLSFAVSVHITRRARLWAAWRALTRREASTNGTA